MRDPKYYRDWRAENRKWFEKVQNLKHGSRATAINWGCRCEPCKTAMDEYNRRYYLEVEAPKRQGPGELV